MSDVLTLWPPSETLRGAIISDCGSYRYALWRQWGVGQPMVFVMLNPSTADAEKDDQTIGRCIGFARREGFGGIHVVNLFAYRATQPDELLTCPVDVVGPANNRHLHEAAQLVSTNGYCVAAWGSHPAATRLAVNRARMALQFPLFCLGLTKGGAPRHPSRLAADTPLISYAERYTSWERS